MQENQENELKFDDLQILEDGRHVVKVHLKDSMPPEYPPTKRPIGLLFKKRQAEEWHAVVFLRQVFKSSSNPYLFDDKQYFIAKDTDLENLKKKLQANIHLISANHKALSMSRDLADLSNSCTDYWRNISLDMKYKELLKVTGQATVKHAMLASWLDTFKTHEN